MLEMHREQHSYRPMRQDDQGKWVSEEIWVDAEVMEREDGLRLIRLGNVHPILGTPVKYETFRYQKHDVAFEFHANRCHWGGTVTGTYSVGALFKRGEMLGKDVWPIERAKFESIAADIDAGLRAWPAPQSDEPRPIGVVHFDFFGSALSQYRLAIGQPLALRKETPSARWTKRYVPFPSSELRPTDGAMRDCPSLVRDDGIQLIRMRTLRGPENDGPDRYLYVADGVSFTFTAERRLSTLVITDTWEVHLNSPYHNGLSPAKRTELGTARCKEIVRSIEEALFAWPPEGYEQFEQEVPVNRVIFLDRP